MVLTDKQYARTGEQCKQEARSPKKEPQRNAVVKKKNTIIEMKNAFDVFINVLDMAEERISELEKISVETPNPKSKENKD